MLQGKEKSPNEGGDCWIPLYIKLYVPMLLQGNLHCVWLLINGQLSTTDIDQTGNDSLHLAAAACHTHIIISLMYAGVDLHARNFNGNTALDLATNKEVRSILSKAMRQKCCAGTGREFGLHELRYRCHCTGRMYSEESSNPSQVPAYPDSDIMMPVRFNADSEYKVQDAETTLMNAMRIDNEAHRTSPIDPHSAAQSLEEVEEEMEEGEDDLSKNELTEDANTSQHDDTELRESDLQPLKKAISGAEQVNASVKLIAQAKRAQERLEKWIALKNELDQLNHRRPLTSRSETDSLRNAIHQAQVAGVAEKRINQAQNSLRLSLAEIRLQGIISVCNRIQFATHEFDGDIKNLECCLKEVSSLGGEGDVVSEGRNLLQRLKAEIDMCDYYDEAKAYLTKVKSSLEEFPEQVMEIPKFEPSPVTAEASSEEISSPSEMYALLPDKDTLLDPHTSFPNDPANDTWLAGTYMLPPEENEGDQKKGKDSKEKGGKGRAQSAGKGSQKKGQDETQEENPLTFPPATDQLRNMRIMKRLLWRVGLSLKVAKHCGVDESMVETRENETSIQDNLLEYSKSDHLEQLEAAELAALKKAKKGKKGKKK